MGHMSHTILPQLTYPIEVVNILYLIVDERLSDIPRMNFDYYQSREDFPMQKRQRTFHETPQTVQL